ncbi:antibiotic biosynthesis monooxygenase [Ramlibacter henchirensis]|uniref:Antibiotic biosynthesis monooxygenase n=1 Tax=Ramlibacter henchirensis TaxID=204072 RepID=A0A4Z0BWS5_9BURK|nr:antibiotic biosynthesis monooxygenase [Ramlibacter henchirensis]TFZ02944.1 antibiotic biosynthesis monooxygenase [Ramlibacter henchirensis]
MIFEIADLRVEAQHVSEFESVVAAAARDYIAKAGGYLRHRILRGVESPNRFVLVIEWGTIEDHTVGFRNSPAYLEWRNRVGPFFASAPLVEHFSVVE